MRAGNCVQYMTCLGDTGMISGGLASENYFHFLLRSASLQARCFKTCSRPGDITRVRSLTLALLGLGISRLGLANARASSVSS